MIFEILDEEISFNDELKSYVERLFFYEKQRDNLIEEVNNKIKTSDVNEVINLINSSYLKMVRKIIAELSEYGIYSRTEDDFIDDNVGYKAFLDSIEEYLEAAKSIEREQTERATDDMEQAAIRAKSQIQGLDFGIITTSVLNSMIYDSMNESKMKKEAKIAAQQFESESNMIMKIANARINSKINTYKTTTFLKNLNDAIIQMYGWLFTKHIAVLASINQFTIETVENIDEKRALAILDNIDIVKDKNQLIIHSIALCPYRIDSYVLAAKNNLFDNGMFNSLKYFGLVDIFIEKLKGILENESKSISSLWRSNKNIYSCLALVTNSTTNEVFTKAIEPMYLITIKEIKSTVQLCNNKNVLLDSVKNKVADVNKYDKYVDEICSSLISSQDIECILTYSNIKFWENETFLINNIGSHSSLIKFVREAYDSVKDDYQKYKLEQKEEEEKEQQRKKRKKTCLKVAIAGVIIFFIGLGIYNNYPNTRFEAAMSCVESGDITKAENIIQYLVSKNYSEVKMQVLYQNLANKCEKEKIYDKAIQYYELLDTNKIEYNKNLSNCYYNEGQRLYYAGKFDEALVAFENVTIEKNEARAYINQINIINTYKEALNYYELQNYEEANKLFESIRDYKDARDYYFKTCEILGDIEYENENYQAALKWYIKCKDIEQEKINDATNLLKDNSVITDDTNTNDNSNIIVNVIDTTYLREGPGYTYNKITLAYAGDTFNKIGEQDDWSIVEYQGQNAYIPTVFVE